MKGEAINWNIGCCSSDHIPRFWPYICSHKYSHMGVSLWGGGASEGALTQAGPELRHCIILVNKSA